MQNLTVFSHLRWDFVFQRPQHVVSRLAARYRVQFVEEPVYDPDGPSLERLTPCPGVEVLRPRTPVKAAGFHDDQIPELRRLLAPRFAEGELGTGGVAWLYTPMALPLLQELKPALVVYDCMDELTAFRGAPRQLAQRESALLRLADVVFAGGRSLYHARRDRHPNIHCFPSSVDARHFALSREGAADHPAQAALPRPRLGYCGVIDERMDLELLAHVAEARPDWQLVLVGPVAKIDPAGLPARPNVHRLGQQAYADLPRFLAGWDVALMPFALNGATRFISPTKTLEYFAAGIPVVSTPIPDVVETYRGSVEIARTPEAFVAACERLLAEDEPARIERARRMQQAVERTSWDATVDAMVSLVERAEAERRPREVPIGTTARPAASRYETVVIGAGPTGLSAAYHLGRGTLLLEREPRVGGWCRSIVDRGFTFDYAGHIMFSNDPYVHEMYRVLLGDNVHWQDREAWVYSKGVHTRYPFQGALYGLPPQVLKECIVGAIEARFGPLKGGGAGAPAPAVRGEPKNFEEFIYRVWGAGVARHFAVPYNVKLWTVPLAEMETSWLGGRVPLPDLEQMIEGALSPVPKPMGPNARFGYPLRGGFQALMDGFLPHLDADLELGASVSSIAPGTRTVTLADGRSVRYRKLVSTMPLPQLVAALGDAAPEEIRTAAARLRHVSVRCVNLGIGRANLTEKHWIYYPEDTVFHRIFVQGNASPHCNPPGGFGLTCEITYSPAKPLPCDGEALVRRCIEDCIRVGMIAADDPVWAANQVDMPYAYVVYDHDRARSVAQIRTWLAERDILLAGRYSEWEYYNSDHAFVAGRRAAEAVRGGAEAEAGRVSAAMPAQSAAATR